MQQLTLRLCNGALHMSLACMLRPPLTCLAALCGGVVIPLLSGSAGFWRVSVMSKLAVEVEDRAAGIARLIGDWTAFDNALSMRPLFLCHVGPRSHLRIF